MDISELATLIIIGIIAGMSMCIIPEESKEIVILACGGLIGYLTKTLKGE